MAHSDSVQPLRDTYVEAYMCIDFYRRVEFFIILRCMERFAFLLHLYYIVRRDMVTYICAILIFPLLSPVRTSISNRKKLTGLW